MNDEVIGKNAGTIWNCLHESEEGLTLSALKKQSGLKNDEAVAAIGWLAREEKLNFETDKRGRTIITLCETETVSA